MEQEETFVLIISIMLCHGVLNMHETKYGEDSKEDILIIGMRRRFETMCMVYE
jgi:hypothetical protein